MNGDQELRTSSNSPSVFGVVLKTLGARRVVLSGVGAPRIVAVGVQNLPGFDYPAHHSTAIGSVGNSVVDFAIDIR